MKRETVSPQGAVGQFFVVWGSCGHGAPRGSGVTERKCGDRGNRGKAPAEQTVAGGVEGVGHGKAWEERSRGLYGLVAKKQGSGP